MPYSDPLKQKAAKAEWYRREYANNPEFRAKQDAKREKWRKTDRGAAMMREQSRASVRRRNPHREYLRFNLDTEAINYIDLVGRLKMAEVPFVERTRNGFITVSFSKRHRAKIEALAKKVLH